MTSGRVNGLEETNICSKGDPVRCCRASAEVAQVLGLHTRQSNNESVFDRRNDFTAEGDGRSAGEEDSDAGEKSESLVWLLEDVANKVTNGPLLLATLDR